MKHNLLTGVKTHPRNVAISQLSCAMLITTILSSGLFANQALAQQASNNAAQDINTNLLANNVDGKLM
ncbi:MAG: hypothetical protein QM529_07150, partial [Hydrotalea sp.]|nr:hypothetical protein [Hydrotalea sp.]